MTELERSYRALFLEADGSKLKPEGESVLRDLEKVTGWMNTSLPTDQNGKVDPLRLAGYHEKRAVFAHIKKRIFNPPK